MPLHVDLIATQVLQTAAVTVMGSSMVMDSLWQSEMQQARQGTYIQVIVTPCWAALASHIAQVHAVWFKQNATLQGSTKVPAMNAMTPAGADAACLGACVMRCHAVSYHDGGAACNTT
jgi:hypothetical protein